MEDEGTCSCGNNLPCSIHNLKESVTTDPEPTMLSVSEEMFTENPSFMIDEECRIPDYASINYEFAFSTPITNDSLLFVEGQCYMACMEHIDDPSAGFVVNVVDL